MIISLLKLSDEGQLVICRYWADPSCALTGKASLLVILFYIIPFSE